jgi:sugar phosphate isomerase/epimerase
LNVTHYLGRPDTAVADLARALAVACEKAADRGFEISVEFIPDTGIPDLATAWQVIEGSQASNVGILLDVFHHARGGGTVESVRRLPPRAINSVQLSDRVAPLPGTPHVPFQGRLLPGEGELPLADLVAAALDNNPDVTVDVEVLSADLAELTPGDVARRLQQSIKSWRDALD